MNIKPCIVRDYMTQNLVTFSREMDVLDAIHELIRHQIAGAPVVDDHGNLVGMLTELDCMKVALNAGYFSEWGGPVIEYMTTDTRTVDAQMSIVDLAQLFLDSQFRRFPVVTDNRLVGLISRRDVLRALEELTKS